MTHYSLDELTRQHIAIDKVTINSFEMGIYLVEVDIDESHGMIMEDGHPYRFHSLTEIKHALQACPVCEAWLVHDSAYDEMIGAADKNDNRLVVPVTLN